jgi:predicted amidohydrolase
MPDVTLTVALVSDVFYSPDGGQRLNRRLREAREAGADLAVLPELALNPWSPATTVVRDDDAEVPGGRRHRLLASAARNVGIAVVGGAIVRDPDSGRRRNTALVFDSGGTLVASYAKVHLPDEEGFHEPSHYEAGKRLAEPVRSFAIPIGLQVCSDINRPEGSHVLAAMGAGAILNPRATEAATFDRWKLVFRATAITASAYVLSVNRPGPEQGVPLGGPSIAVDPNGDVLFESTAPVAVVTLSREALDNARRRYPGYLAVNADLYSHAWRRAARSAQGLP